MPGSREKPIETLNEAAKSETSSPRTQWHRTVFFWILLLATILGFSTLTILVETTPSFPIDLQITQAIQSIDAPSFAWVMRLISWPGFLPQSVLITLLIGFTLYMFDFRWESIAALFTAFISGVTNESVKYWIQRPRPAADLVDVFEVLSSYSFPSGHVMFYTIVFGFVWYLAYTVLKRSVKRTVVLGIFGTLVALVGMSRIYLGQHWASDVLGAYLLGGLILAGIILLHRWGKSRFFVHQSPVSNSDRV